MSEARTLLADTVARLFREGASKGDAASKDTAGAASWDASLWQRIEEMGIPLLLVAQDAGGIGGTWEDAFVVLQALGRNAIALPVGEAMLAARLAALAGLDPPPGRSTLASKIEGQLERDDRSGEMRFTGEALRVPWGRHASSITGVVLGGWQPHVVVLARAAAVSMDLRRNPAGEPRDMLRFQDARVLAACCDRPEARRLEEFCALARIGQIAGALEAALELSLAHARQRSQFGKAIGNFQAVQQQLALLGAETAAVGCAARAACRAADRIDATFEIAAAKLRANRAIDAATTISHQVHGAMGLTREYDLRRATQRLWSWRTEFGNDRYWSALLGEAVAARGAEAFWSDLTRRGDKVGLAAA